MPRSGSTLLTAMVGWPRTTLNVGLWTLDPASRIARSRHLKYRLDLDGDVAGQRAHAHGAAGAEALFGPPHVREELAATVDHRGMLLEFRRAVDHAEDLHHALYLVQGAEVRAQ